MSYTLVIDQSTSATKAMLFGKDDKRPAFAKAIAHKQIFPKPGWVEHDPMEILDNTYRIVRELCEESNISRLASVAITNQRETVVVWNRHTGKPVYNAIVWQCNRGTAICDALLKQGKEPEVRQKTGLLINPYFSASGIQWILDEVEGARQAAEAGDLLFGTMDSWLLWNFTGGKVHATDHTNASRTLLLNIHTCDWDAELFRLFNIPMQMAPEVKFSDAIYGTTRLGFLSEDIPVAGMLGDSHGALAGQMCFHPGMGKVTYGTGSSMMIHIGENPVSAPEGLVTSVAFSALGKVYYAFEGNIHYTGASIQWLIEEVGLIQHAAETEALSLSVYSTDGVYLVPAFTGLGAPWWDKEARALICGMNRGTRKAHLVRATLESIAYQIRDLMSLVLTAGIPLKALNVDGGPVKNNFLMQFQADQLQTVIHKSTVSEASAYGAYLMNALALKEYASIEAIEAMRVAGESIYPKMMKEQADILYDGWIKAVARALLK